MVNISEGENINWPYGDGYRLTGKLVQHIQLYFVELETFSDHDGRYENVGPMEVLTVEDWFSYTNVYS